MLSQHYRREAMKIREALALARDPLVQQHLSEIAVRYDLLATHAEHRESQPPKPEP